MFIVQQTDLKFTSILLFGVLKNTFILDVAIDYIISTGKFYEP